MTHYLENAARQMLAADQVGRPVLPVLKKLCPHVAQQISADGRQRDFLSLWGRSCNIDEIAGQTIVPVPILHAIGELAGVPLRGRFVHAGLEHTYGYLFSLIETPYGLKRDRWVTTALEEGFGLDPTLLSDRPNEGTLLGNLTWFLARIVYRGQPAFLPDENVPIVAPEIRRYDYDRCRVTRIVERTTFLGRDLFISTDLVPFPHLPTDTTQSNHLLVYCLQRGSKRPDLITAFPVTSEMVEQLKASARSPRQQSVRLRYNAYVRGLYGRTVRGTRQLLYATSET